MEHAAFIDGFNSEYCRAHFDTGNIMMFQFPEHWISVLGKRIKNTHFKEYTKKGQDYSLESFRPLLDGTTDWPAVTEALDFLSGASFLHLSLDMDAVDPMFAPGVGTPVRGGLSYREAHLAMELLAESTRIDAIEVVEVNPVLDRENATAQLAVELVASALGARIL